MLQGFDHSSSALAERIYAINVLSLLFDFRLADQGNISERVENPCTNAAS